MGTLYVLFSGRLPVLLGCLIIIAMHTGLDAQSLALERKGRTIVLRPQDELTLFVEKRGVKNDSIEMMLRGELRKRDGNHLHMLYDEYALHNFYKNADDSLHYVDEILRDTMLFTTVSLHNVTGIYKHRSKLTKMMSRVVFVTLGTSLATMPLVLAMKPGPTRDIVSTVNLASAATMLTSAAIGIVFAKKKLWIQPRDKKSWTIVE